jgi:hypothetical protein
MKRLLLLITMVFAGQVSAQDLPQTRLWLVSLENGETGTPELISTNPGYNNQPRFSPNGSTIWYTGEQDGHTQIRYHRLDDGSGGLVAKTGFSEYSPTPIPDQNALSVVRVEADEKQRLWRIDLESKEFSLLFPDLEPVGYFAWMDDNSIAAFILGETFDLYTAHTGNPNSEKVLSNIGRTLLTHPKSGEILFVDKNTEQIAAMEPGSGKIRSVMSLFPGEEDFSIGSDGVYWTGIGSKLYRQTETADGWQLVADLLEYGIGDISRLAISPETNRIALVGED